MKLIMPQISAKRLAVLFAVFDHTSAISRQVTVLSASVSTSFLRISVFLLVT